MKALMKAMEEQGIKKLEIKDEKGFSIALERETVCSKPLPREHKQEEVVRVARTRREGLPKDESTTEEKEGVDYVTSPMVGTFYTSPSPDESTFVKVGDVVEEDTVVCIIEAMKVMNEVKAGKKGKVSSILVGNAHPVDFGTKLFQIVETV